MTTPCLIHNDEVTYKDGLAREVLRRHFGEAIAHCEPPHVFGLHGEWGSGKTSFLRQLRYELDNVDASTPKEGLITNHFGNHVVTVWFDAWRYQSEPLPVIALLQEIRRQLEQRSLTRKASAEAKKLAAISLRSVMNSFDDVAKLLKLESISSKGIEATGEAWEKDHLQTKLGIDSIREFLEHAIQNLLEWKAKASTNNKARLVVFIDDLDRCQPATAFKLLEALKVHFSIPNCIFVLGMNQQTVVEAIASELKREEKDALPRLKAEAYLEKLCTNVWRLPLPDAKKNLEFFTALLADDALRQTLRERLKDCRCLPPNPRRLKALANVVNRLWTWAKPMGTKGDILALATLFYAYIYQFHGDIFRRWQWDHDYVDEMKDFANSTGKFANPSDKNKEHHEATGFDGLILPKKLGEAEQPISNYPDPSIAGVFWIAPLIQRGGPCATIRSEDFQFLHGLGL